MALYTTYLGFLKTKLGKSLFDGSAKLGGKETCFLYVMRKRGNREVEPPEMLLDIHLPLLKYKKEVEKCLGECITEANINLAFLPCRDGVTIRSIIPDNILQTFVDWIRSNPYERLEDVLWQGYRDAYLDSLANSESRKWMGDVASQSVDRNVVLVCFERSNEHCHRRLLAELIAHDYRAEYLGELT